MTRLSNPVPQALPGYGTASVTGTLAAAGDAVALAVVTGAQSATFAIFPGAAGLTANFQYTLDSGANWFTLACGRVSTLALQTTFSSAGDAFAADIPPGATHVRILASGAGAALTVGIYIDPYTVGPLATVLSASTARVGFMAASGLMIIDSSTPLGAGATFIGTARDTSATINGVQFASASTYAKEFRAIAAQDVAFTLYIAAARSTADTYRRVAQAASVAISGVQVASLAINPAWRQVRVEVVNGGVAAGFTEIGSCLMAA